MKKRIQEIEIDRLYIDQDNARYGDNSAHNRREAIKKMFEIPKMAEKIINLARHISENGLDPSELPLVFPYNEEDGFGNGRMYIAAEGNRRILAIILLHRPELAPTDTIRKKIEKLTSPEIKKNLASIQCSVLPTREDTNMWVDLKHTGQNKGIGRVEWDGVATNTFRARMGKTKSAGLQIREYIEADKDFNKDLKEKSKEIDITNLTRFFQSKPAKEALGISTDKGLLEANVPLDYFRISIEEVIRLMLQNDFSVKDVYHDSDRKAFIKRLPQAVLSSGKDRIAKGWKLSNFDEKKLTADQKIGKNKKTIRNGLTKSIPSSETRKRLIDFTLKIENKRINAIYKEFKEKLNVYETPNAVSVLFRVFLELSTDHFIEKNNITRSDNGKKLSRDDKLRTRIEHVCNYLEKNKTLTIPQAKATRIMASEKEGFFSIDSFNRLVHYSELSPIPATLNTWMDNWAPYLKAIWK